MAFAETPKRVIITGGPVLYYVAYDTSNLYVEKAFGGECNSITIQNTHASDPVQLSFDGATLHGELNAGESIQLQVSGKSSVYVKSTAGNAVVRIWGY